MKLIPNKGYVVLSKLENTASIYELPNEHNYKVEAVSQDSPLCKVGDQVLVYDVIKHYKDYMIAREEDILAWVED